MKIEPPEPLAMDALSGYTDLEVQIKRGDPTMGGL